MSKLSLRRIFRELAFVCFSTILASCSTLPLTVLPVTPEVAPEDFLGITDLQEAPGSNRIRILFIHGIGEHTACDPDTLLLHLSKALSVRVQMPEEIEEGAHCALPVPKPIQVPADHARDTALLYRYELASDVRRVTFMFLLWSTLTDVPKESLVEPDLPHHALLTEAAKNFEDMNLSDVLLYGGDYRDVIRPAIERGLCLFVEGTPGADPWICNGAHAEIPTAVVTHSLGGYIFMDAMHDIYKHRKRGNAASAVGHYLDQVFMLANQLKMLDLTTRRYELLSSQFAKTFHEEWTAMHAERPRAPYASKRQLLAISDPNDILSWEVTKSEFNRPDTTVANVYLGTTGEFFGVFHTPILGVAANPVAAHLNYLADDDVMDIVACGIHGSQIRRCGQ